MAAVISIVFIPCDLSQVILRFCRHRVYKADCALLFFRFVSFSFCMITSSLKRADASTLFFLFLFRGPCAFSLL